MAAMTTQHEIQPDALAGYITKRILPAVGRQGASFTLELISSGSRNIIWFLTIADGGKYVLKAVSKRFRIKNIIWAHAYLERRGLPVPRLLFADRAWKTARTMGYYFACEERVDGIALDGLGDERAGHIKPVAALFASMHANRSLRWGKMKSFQILGFGEYLMRKAAERIEALAGSGCTVQGKPAAGLLAWFEQKKTIIKPFWGFNLCHGDVNMKNILLSPGGSIRLIDTEAFKFLPFQIEYFRLAYGLCGFDAAALEQFTSAYAAAATIKNLQRLETQGFFYHAYVLLEIAWHFNKKLKRENLPAAELRGCRENRGKALEHLAAVIEKKP